LTFSEGEIKSHFMEFQLKAVCCIVKITKILSKLEMVDAGVRLTSYFQTDFCESNTYDVS